MILSNKKLGEKKCGYLKFRLRNLFFFRRVRKRSIFKCCTEDTTNETEMNFL